MNRSMDKVGSPQSENSDWGDNNYGVVNNE